MQEFQFEQLHQRNLAEVLELEEVVLSSLERPDQLRRNTPAMWNACLDAPHTAIGVREEEKLVALAVLYVPQPNDGEDLSHLLAGLPCSLLTSANYKICMVHPHFRGHGLQQQLGSMLEDQARKQHLQLLCSTASPYNTASVQSLLHLGYQLHSTLSKYGFQRNLYYKALQ